MKIEAKLTREQQREYQEINPGNQSNSSLGVIFNILFYVFLIVAVFFLSDLELAIKFGVILFLIDGVFYLANVGIGNWRKRKYLDDCEFLNLGAAEWELSDDRLNFSGTDTSFGISYEKIENVVVAQNCSYVVYNSYETLLLPIQDCLISGDLNMFYEILKQRTEKA